jgi:hypothetical protein
VRDAVAFVDRHDVVDTLARVENDPRRSPGAEKCQDRLLGTEKTTDLKCLEKDLHESLAAVGRQQRLLAREDAEILGINMQFVNENVMSQLFDQRPIRDHSVFDRINKVQKVLFRKNFEADKELLVLNPDHLSSHLRSPNNRQDHQMRLVFTGVTDLRSKSLVVENKRLIRNSLQHPTPRIS